MSVIAKLPRGLQLSINFDVLGEFDVFSVDLPPDPTLDVSDVRLDTLVDRAAFRARVIDLVPLERRPENHDELQTPSWLHDEEPDLVDRPARSRRFTRRHRTR